MLGEPALPSVGQQTGRGGVPKGRLGKGSLAGRKRFFPPSSLRLSIGGTQLPLEKRGIKN